MVFHKMETIKNYCGDGTFETILYDATGGGSFGKLMPTLTAEQIHAMLMILTPEQVGALAKQIVSETECKQHDVSIPAPLAVFEAHTPVVEAHTSVVEAHTPDTENLNLYDESCMVEKELKVHKIALSLMKKRLEEAEVEEELKYEHRDAPPWVKEYLRLDAKDPIRIQGLERHQEFQKRLAIQDINTLSKFFIEEDRIRQELHRIITSNQEKYKTLSTSKDLEVQQEFRRVFYNI